MKEKRNIIRVTLFIVIFAFAFSALTSVFVPKTVYSSQYKTFSELPRDSMDVIFVGSSSILTGVSPLTIWDETGIVSYMRASPIQAPHMTYMNTADTLKNQKPKVLVLGMLFLFENYKVDTYPKNMHAQMDVLPLSFTKLEEIKTIFDRSSDKNVSDYVFPFLRYHDRWDRLKTQDFQPPERDALRGHKDVYKRTPVERLEGKIPAVSDGGTAQYNADSLFFYEKTIQLCLHQGIDVMIVTMPRGSWDSAMHNATQTLADKYGLVFVDYNTDDKLRDIALDYQEDFFNPNHLNAQGAARVSRDLGRVLREAYNLPDRRGEETLAKDWNKDHKAFIGKLQKRFANPETNDNDDGIYMGEG